MLFGCFTIFWGNKMITILDGGMGQELIARSTAEPTPLWATKVLLEEPELVRAVHDDFFAAGAMVATTNSYAIHHDRLIPAGLDDQFESLHRVACEIACASRDTAGGGRVAGAIGPLVGSIRPALCHRTLSNVLPKFAGYKRLMWTIS